MNGVHCSDSKKLFTDILRTGWGFQGMVVTDCGALNDRILSFQAGCDLNMPGGSQFMEQAALDAVKSGSLSETDIDASVERILGDYFRCAYRSLAASYRDALAELEQKHRDPL